jgi:hypothetical protein
LQSVPINLVSSNTALSHGTDTEINGYIGDNVDAAFWTAAECNVAIICAALLVIRIFPRFASNLSYPRKTDGRVMSSYRKSRGAMLTDNMNEDYLVPSTNPRLDGAFSRGTLSGIEVTTEVVQESTKGNALETTSQRRLLMDA